MSIVLLTFLLPFIAAVGHAYELLNWNGFGYFFKINTAVFLCVWAGFFCLKGPLLAVTPPRYARSISTIITLVAILALFCSFPICLCLHLFCVLGLLVLALILRTGQYLPRWYYCLHFVVSFVIVFCYALIFTANV